MSPDNRIVVSYRPKAVEPAQHRQVQEEKHGRSGKSRHEQAPAEQVATAHLYKTVIYSLSLLAALLVLVCLWDR